jgi:DNA-binding GntR family transcriptional regulator
MGQKPHIEIPDVQGLEEATSQEKAYRRLRHAIMIGRIGPGVALTIRGLAGVLGVSPTPVREALRRLAAESALAVLDNRRVMTPPMTSLRFEELIALRKTLECHAAERSIPYINELVIGEMERVDLRMDEAIEAGDHEAAVILNQRFHSLLCAANPEQVIMPMIDSVWLQLGPFTRVALQHMGQHYTVDRHKEAIEALRKRDPIAVSIAIEADIRDGLSHVGRLGLIHQYSTGERQRRRVKSLS